MKSLISVFNAAFENEELQTPVKQQEDEVVMYCEIKDFTGLSKATSKESHEQWEIKTDKGRVRIRKTIKDGLEPTFNLTFKTKNSTDSVVSGSDETTYDISSEMFESFKALSDQGMIKDRFKFPVQSIQIKDSTGIRDIQVPEMFYEVDVFKKHGIHNETEGQYHEWCKIDLEVNPLTEMISKNHPEIGDFSLNIKARILPLALGDILLSTDEDVVIKDRITKLYDQYFLTKK